MFDTIKKIFTRDEEIENFLKRFPNDVGKYGYDAWGFNIKTIKRYITLGRYFFEDFFEVEVIGNENVPKEGRCLIIANHSGQLPIDAILLGYALVVNPIAPRAPKGMYERFIPTLPFFSYWFSQMGGAVGDIENCINMLENDEAVMVFPEGARGISKPSSKKYQLQKFGRGFLHMARQTGSPVIPVGIAGCEEILYSYGNLDFLEKLLRFPAMPLLVPYLHKSKVIINIGKPIYFENKEESDYLAGADVKIVKKEINRLMQEGLEIRTQRMREK